MVVTRAEQTTMNGTGTDPFESNRMPSARHAPPHALGVDVPRQHTVHSRMHALSRVVWSLEAGNLRFRESVEASRMPACPTGTLAGSPASSVLLAPVRGPWYGCEPRGEKKVTERTHAETSRKRRCLFRGRWRSLLRGDLHPAPTAGQLARFGAGGGRDADARTHTHSSA